MHIHPTPLQNSDVNILLGTLNTGVRLMGVSTLNGAGAIDGTSGKLGNEFDSALFQALRRWADVVVVGAGTAREEDYKDADTPIAIVTRSGNLPEGLTSPIILDSPESAEEIVSELRSRGFERIVVEGGPSLFAQFIEENAFDYLHLTIDPQLSADHSPLLPVTLNHHRLTIESMGATEDSVIFVRLSPEKATHDTGW